MTGDLREDWEKDQEDAVWGERGVLRTGVLLLGGDLHDESANWGEGRVPGEGRGCWRVGRVLESTESSSLGTREGRRCDLF